MSGDWLHAEAQAFLCNLAKAPKYNGQAVEVAGWNAEKQRWKCLLPNGGDVNVFAANLEPTEMPAETVAEVLRMVAEGRRFDAWRESRGRWRLPDELLQALKKVAEPHVELKLVPVDGKGLGYVAAADVKQGDLLIHETALCSGVMRLKDSYQGPSVTSNACEMYADMARQMYQDLGGAFVEEKVMSLHKGYSENVAKINAVLDCNTVECSREPGSVALFLATSRLNHSCCPNAYVDATRTECVVRALCDIPKGAEVCISYVPVSEPLERRREKLKNYNFECDCARCQQEAESDPHVSVPCSCNKFSFQMRANARNIQTCPTCYSGFDREESMHQLSKISEANKQMHLLQSDPEGHLKKLTDLAKFVIHGARNGIPPSHTETVLLYSNLSAAHGFMARRAEAPEEPLRLCHKFKRKAIEAFERKHGSTRQRDVDFFQLLYSGVSTPGGQEAAFYAEKLAEACVWCFGQPDLPDSLKPKR